MKPAKIIVAYKLKLVPELVPSADQFNPPATYKSDEAIAKWRANKAADLQADCLVQPYTSTFERVEMIDISNKRKAGWEAVDGKPPVALRVRAWLLSAWPNAWPHSTHVARAGGVPDAVFIGFNPKLFVKVLGHECSLPKHQPKLPDGKPDAAKSNVLPLAMWMETDYRDIENLVKSSDYSGLTWDTVLRARELRELYPDWNGPNVNVVQDLQMATELATQLGMLMEDSSCLEMPTTPLPTEAAKPKNNEAPTAATAATTRK